MTVTTLAPSSTPRSRAIERAEHTLAVVAAISRAAALVLLGATLMTVSWDGARAVPLALLTAVVLVASVGLIVSCLRTGRVGRGWGAFDAVCVVGVVGLSAVPAVLPGPAEQTPFYNFAVLAAIAFGLPRWPLLGTLPAALALAAPNVASALRPGSTYPVWNAVPDSMTFVGAGLLAWCLAWVLRTSAQSADRHTEAAVARAGDLARERERARQQQDLGASLLSTVDELAAADVITDPLVREQIRREAQWLRRVVEAGLPEPDTGLVPALRERVAEKLVAGMSIDLELPPVEPVVAPATASAVADAVREALTNVVKHAGTMHASVVVRPEPGGVAVEITDVGRGYDPADIHSRVGQRRSIRERVEAVGGRVEFDSAPGRGTRVRLWVPTPEEQS